MTPNEILPTYFNGNIYLFRAKLSNNLTRLVQLRLHATTEDSSLYMINSLNDSLIKDHVSYVQTVKTIDTLECDIFGFGAPHLNSKT